MRLMIVFIVSLSFAFGAAPVRAETPVTPESLQAAKELLAITSGDIMTQLTSQIGNAFWPSIVQRAKAQKIDDATIAELRAEFDKIQLAFVTEVMNEAPPIYARHFTVAELHELTAFYKSPTGAKALHELPQVMGEFTGLLVPRLQTLQQQTSDAFNKILRAHGYIK
ncbi:MAG: DUF2059 domain-containing protein [Methylovirgula sp.]